MIDTFNPIVILRLRNMTAIDATGLHALEQFSRRLRRPGRTLLVCGARHQPAKFLAKAEFVEEIGRENITPHVEAALAGRASSRRDYADDTGLRRHGSSADFDRFTQIRSSAAFLTCAASPRHQPTGAAGREAAWPSNGALRRPGRLSSA